MLGTLLLMHCRTAGFNTIPVDALNDATKLASSFLMYIGRLGPVTFFLALALRPNANRREILPEGKIQIG